MQKYNPSIVPFQMSIPLEINLLNIILPVILNLFQRPIHDIIPPNHFTVPLQLRLPVRLYRPVQAAFLHITL